MKAAPSGLSSAWHRSQLFFIANVIRLHLHLRSRWFVPTNRDCEAYGCDKSTTSRSIFLNFSQSRLAISFIGGASYTSSSESTNSQSFQRLSASTLKNIERQTMIFEADKKIMLIVSEGNIQTCESFFQFTIFNYHFGE